MPPGLPGARVPFLGVVALLFAIAWVVRVVSGLF